MPIRDNKLSLKSRLKNAKSQLTTFGKSYEFTAERQAALKKAQEASAEARRLASKPVGGSQNALSKAQVIANRFVNRVTGSNTSALKKRQMAKQKISTTANTAGSTAKALTGTAATMYKGYKAQATKKISSTVGNLRGAASYSMNRNTANAYKSAGAAQNMARTSQSGPASVRNDGFATVGRNTLKANYTQAGQSMQAGRTMAAAKGANRSQSGPTGTSTAKSAYTQGNGNTSRSQFISRTVNRLTRNGTKPETAKRTAEQLWKQKQVNDRKNKRVK
jgi:hypothetical protein